MEKTPLEGKEGLEIQDQSKMVPELESVMEEAIVEDAERTLNNFRERAMAEKEKKGAVKKKGKKNKRC